MNKILIFIFLCFLNTTYSFGYEIPDQYFYGYFGYGTGNDESSLVNGLLHKFGYNLTFYDFWSETNFSILLNLKEEKKHTAVFIYPFGVKVNGFIGYEGIYYFGYEKYIRPKNINKGYFITVDGYYIPRINSGIEVQLFIPYFGLIPTYNFHNNNFQLFMQMRGELGWDFTNDFGLRLSLAVRTPDLLRIEEDSVSLNLLLGIIYNPFRSKNIEYEIQKKEKEERARREQQERTAIMYREERERNRQESVRDYEKALKTTGVVQLAEYIKKWEKSEFLHRESYIEIARRLSENNNVKFIELKGGQNVDIPNPYNFDSSAIYYFSQFTVQQWVGASFLADISNGSNIRRDTRIFIRNIYDIGNISRVVTNAYLRYVGVYEYTAVSGALTVVPKFDLLFSF
jgi:hypothetical protein